MANKIKQVVMGKELGWLQKKNFLKCLWKTKGLRKSVGGFSQEYWILKTG